MKKLNNFFYKRSLKYYRDGRIARLSRCPSWALAHVVHDALITVSLETDGIITAYDGATPTHEDVWLALSPLLPMLTEDDLETALEDLEKTHLIEWADDGLRIMMYGELTQNEREAATKRPAPPSTENLPTALDPITLPDGTTLDPIPCAEDGVVWLPSASELADAVRIYGTGLVCDKIRTLAGHQRKSNKRYGYHKMGYTLLKFCREERYKAPQAPQQDTGEALSFDLR